MKVERLAVVAAAHRHCRRMADAHAEDEPSREAPRRWFGWRRSSPSRRGPRCWRSPSPRRCARCRRAAWWRGRTVRGLPAPRRTRTPRTRGLRSRRRCRGRRWPAGRSRRSIRRPVRAACRSRSQRRALRRARVIRAVRTPSVSAPGASAGSPAGLQSKLSNGISRNHSGSTTSPDCRRPERWSRHSSYVPSYSYAARWVCVGFLDAGDDPAHFVTLRAQEPR